MPFFCGPGGADADAGDPCRVRHARVGRGAGSGFAFSQIEDDSDRGRNVTQGKLVNLYDTETDKPDGS